MLFLMIASLNIYGRELKVSKDTVITYTLEDNRKIAILLKQGEYDAALCKSLKSIIVKQDTLIDGLKYTLYTLTNQANETDSRHRRQRLHQPYQLRERLQDGPRICTTPPRTR